MKIKRLITLLIPLVLLTGCGQNKDFVSEAIKNSKPEFGIYSELPELKIEENKYRPGDVDINTIYDILMESQYADYIEFNEFGLSISTEAYLEAYAEEKGITLVELSDEDKRAMITEGKNWDKFKWYHDENIIYLKNDKGEVANGYAYLLLMEDEQIKESLVSAGYQVGVSQMELAEKSMKENTDKVYLANIGNCSIFYYRTYFSMSVKGVYISKEVEYLANLYQKDNWVITQGARNSVVDTLTMYYELNEYYDEKIDEFITEGINLYLYAGSNELKEIEIIFPNYVNSIPEDGYPTITKCLTELGCSEEDINEILKSLPSNSGEIGNLEYFVESVDKKNTRIMFIVR